MHLANPPCSTGIFFNLLPRLPSAFYKETRKTRAKRRRHGGGRGGGEGDDMEGPPPSKRAHVSSSSDSGQGATSTSTSTPSEPGGRGSTTTATATTATALSSSARFLPRANDDREIGCLPVHAVYPSGGLHSSRVSSFFLETLSLALVYGFSNMPRVICCARRSCFSKDRRQKRAKRDVSLSASNNN